MGISIWCENLINSYYRGNTLYIYIYRLYKSNLKYNSKIKKQIMIIILENYAL